MKKKLQIYLAGRCKGLDDYGKKWRYEASKTMYGMADFVGVDLTMFNPTKYFDYGNNSYSQKTIKSYYLNKLKQCDVVLLNCNGTEFSIGTAQEVQYAVDNGIPVIGFGCYHTYSWITDVDCQVVFETMNEALDYIRDYYMIGG